MLKKKNISKYIISRDINRAQNVEIFFHVRLRKKARSICYFQKKDKFIFFILYYQNYFILNPFIKKREKEDNLFVACIKYEYLHSKS